MLSAKVSEKSVGKMRPMRLLAVFLVPAVALILGAAVPEGWADRHNRSVQFGDQAIFFEYNSTDQDLGLHIFFDAEAWTEVEVIGRDGEEIFETENDGSLSDIGSTEVFTESAEPPLCPEDVDEDECDVDQAIREFQARFPEGKYKFRGETVEGARLRGSAMLSHALPGAPEINFPEEDVAVDLDPSEDFIVEWSSGDGDAETVRYEVVVEFAAEDGRVFKFVVQVPATDAASQTMTVPQEFFESFAEINGEYKAEVLAMAASRNATITERDFEFD
jgi:hypothetical protein